MKQSKGEENNSFLFQVDILVSAETNGEALERLLHVLNGGGFADFRVDSGIQLGQVIEEALAQDKKKPAASSPAPAGATASLKAKAAASAKNSPAASVPDATEQRIREYIQTNNLIRLNINKGRGIKLSIPCRILSFDNASQVMTVYHVDEKQVHSIKLFEIDDFLE